MFKTPSPRLAFAAVLSASAPLLALGCATSPPPAPTSAAITMSCKQPNTTPMQETQEMQTKGGVQIIVAVQPFRCVPAVNEQRAPGKLDFGESLVASKTHPGKRYVEVTRTPYLQVDPGRLKVTLKIVNQLARVFRGAGAVVQFTVAGKTWASKQEDYAEFSNVIIPPRGEQQIEIYGPPTADLPPTANLGLFLYDVVTKVDPAGNVVEKQNYEWYYSYGLQLKEEQGTVQVSSDWE